ncbi:IS4 family transposase [Shewanella sp. FDAARGOS_354]|uniref:IS4 family transposase n=1 Tax=Shewanella sp. FDAARGOS_354 TaxID=1930557 RepID=UPI0018667AB5|nr:IS4 family transposase [Shewanella sp. FDAARGOS_354]
MRAILYNRFTTKPYKAEAKQTVSHNNTVIHQLLRFIPRHEFESLAKQHHKGRSFRTASRWSQFVTLTIAQLAGRSSLRDIVENMTAQLHRLYHIGTVKLSRTTLARINEDKPYALYEALFGRVLARCQAVSPKHNFRFKNALFSLDATTIDLCLSAFPWAEFRSTKGAIKLHVGLNHNGYLPEFITITDGKTHDITAARALKLPPGSIVAVDKGYNDYKWYNHLNNNGIFFVTRLKSNAKYRVLVRQDVDKSKGITSDQVIQFTGSVTSERCPIALRRIGYRDDVTGKRYVFLTNNRTLSAKTIAEIYKARWQVELFFKWIKQNLKIKSFIGTSKNAVLTQIWIAMC